jgi:biotin carboxyl carrier protein
MRSVRIGEGEVRPASLIQVEGGEAVIRLGQRSAQVRIAFRGDTAYIRAFDRTFALRVLDPVEQAAQETGGRAGTTRAPMPGVVVEVKVAPGDQVAKGQPLMIIESMKILTVITAPRNGEVARVHFEQGRPFEKNAPLVTLREKEEE